MGPFPAGQSGESIIDQVKCRAVLGIDLVVETAMPAEVEKRIQHITFIVVGHEQREHQPIADGRNGRAAEDPGDQAK